MYIHGYGSFYDQNSDKVKSLMTIGDVCGVTIDYSNSIEHITTMLESAIMDMKPDLLVGTSMGGFYANRLGNILDIPFVMLNPAIEPNITLFNLCIPDTILVSSYKDQFKSTGIGLLLLNLGDELINPINTYDKYSSSFRTIVFNGGNHRFSNISTVLHNIKDFYETLEYTIGTDARFYQT